MTLARQPIPIRRRAGWSALVIGAAALIVGIVSTGRGGGLSGRYDEAGGMGTLEFKGRRVYVTTVLGTTFAAEYELDGRRIILKGPGGSQVLTREGDTLQGGMNLLYVKVGSD